MDPRISFSYGFADVHHQQHQGPTSIDQDAVFTQASTPDFEFSTASLGLGIDMNTTTTSSSSCAPADELFSQGKIKVNIQAAATTKVSTLRDELLVNHDNDDLNTGRKGWKNRFGFRKTRTAC